MGGFCSCLHVPDGNCFCPGCLFDKLKNKYANVYTLGNGVSSPNQQASSTNPALPLNTESAARRPNDVAVSSSNGPLQVQPEPVGHVDTKVGILVSPNPVQRFKSYAEALSSSFEHMFPSSEDADECPTCLEEYTPENPKIMAKCSHHYHLSCIYEWMERNENCPVCGKLMLFDE